MSESDFDKPNQTSVNVIENWDTRPDGASIYTKTWVSTIEPPIATVVFLHGFGEHVGRYDFVFEKFALKGIQVFGFDRRGFGQTAVRHKNPGQVNNMNVVIDDITSYIVSNRRPNIPQFLFGHSMGGFLTVSYASDGPERDNLHGIVLSAPLIDLAPPSRVPKSTLALGSILSKVFPNFAVPVSLNKKYISRDPKEVEKYEKDPLNHNFCTLRGITEMISHTKVIYKEKYKNITLPTYISFGTADGINDFNVAKDFFEKIPSKEKTWKEYPGLYHELHYEDVRDTVIDDYINWILEKANSSNNNIST